MRPAIITPALYGLYCRTMRTLIQNIVYQKKIHTTRTLAIQKSACKSGCRSFQSASAPTSRLYPMDCTSDHKSLVQRYLFFFSPDPFYQDSSSLLTIQLSTLPELHFHDAYLGDHLSPHLRFTSRFPCRRHLLYQSYRLQELRIPNFISYTNVFHLKLEI